MRSGVYNLFEHRCKMVNQNLNTYLLRLTDWLRAGQSGDRILMETRFYAPVRTGPGAHPASCTMGNASFAGVKSGLGVTLTPHPLLVPWSRKSKTIPLLSMGHTACTEPHCLYSRAIPLLPLWAVRPVQSLGACTVELYLYSPYGPYGLYRASVPVQ